MFDPEFLRNGMRIIEGSTNLVNQFLKDEGLTNEEIDLVNYWMDRLTLILTVNQVPMSAKRMPVTLRALAMMIEIITAERKKYDELKKKENNND